MRRDLISAKQDDKGDERKELQNSTDPKLDVNNPGWKRQEQRRIQHDSILRVNKLQQIAALLQKDVAHVPIREVIRLNSGQDRAMDNQTALTIN